MYEQARAVVNNASVLAWRCQERQSHYAAAKAGVMALDPLPGDRGGRARRAHQRRQPEPGHARQPGQGDAAGLLEELTSKEAFGRAAEPWEIANVMGFLASDLSIHDRRGPRRLQPAPLTPHTPREPTPSPNPFLG